MSTELRVHGIPNCDTVRAARNWLEARGVPYRFHDFRRDGVPEDALRGWLRTEAGAQLLNRRSATWRQMAREEREAALADPAPALLRHPTLIKRPVITSGDTLLMVGFSPDTLEDIL